MNDRIYTKNNVCVSDINDFNDEVFIITLPKKALNNGPNGGYTVKLPVLEKKDNSNYVRIPVDENDMEYIDDDGGLMRIYLFGNDDNRELVKNLNLSFLSNWCNKESHFSFGDICQRIKFQGKPFWSITVPERNIVKDKSGEYKNTKYNCYMVRLPTKEKNEHGRPVYETVFAKRDYVKKDGDLLNCLVFATNKIDNLFDYNIDLQVLSKVCDAIKKKSSKNVPRKKSKEKSVDKQVDDFGQIIKDDFNKPKANSGSPAYVPRIMTEDDMNRETVIKTVHRTVDTVNKMYVISDVDILNKTRNKDDEQNVSLFNTLQYEYNSFISFAENNEIELDEDLLFKTSDSDDFDDIVVKMRYSRDGLYMFLRDYCDNNTIKTGDALPSISYNALSNHFVKYRTIVDGKLFSSDHTNDFNKERGLEIYDKNGCIKTCDVDGKKFNASFNGYAFSEKEQKLLADGASIILTDVANSSNTGFNNIICSLHVLLDDSPLRKTGITYGISVDGYADVLSSEFRNTTYNEKYRMNRSLYDLMYVSVKKYDVMYKNYTDKLMKGKSESACKKIKSIKSAVEVSNEADGYGSTKSMKNKLRKECNYYIPAFIDTASKSNAIIVKHRNPLLLASTKSRTLEEPPSKKGKELYGFETKYDEDEFNSCFKYQKKIVSRLKNALSTTINMCSMDTDLQSSYDCQIDLLDSFEFESELRQQSVGEESLNELGIKNEWEKFVLIEHEELEKPKDGKSYRRAIDFDGDSHFRNSLDRVKEAMRIRSKCCSNIDLNDDTEFDME